ncbi:MAG: DUF6314 family protein [Pseudomonadota bacterium]
MKRDAWIDGDAAALLQGLAGAWALERRIADRRAGEAGTFSGRAVFTPDADGLRYREAGGLRLPGRPALQAERVYLWRAAAGWIDVRFDDGRPFHRFAPPSAGDGGAGPDAPHLCGRDLYQVRYAFESGSSWSAVWEVRGPRKDYRLVSHYTRAASGQG